MGPARISRSVRDLQTPMVGWARPRHPRRHGSSPWISLHASDVLLFKNGLHTLAHLRSLWSLLRIVPGAFVKKFIELWAVFYRNI